MSWGQRGAQRYYYRSVRRNGQVCKEYVGTGPEAERVAAADAAQRAQHRAAAGAWRKERGRLEALDAQFGAWWETGALLINAALYTEGYYRHDRGQWRKRRPSDH
jgi:hypothetical protein